MTTKQLKEALDRLQVNPSRYDLAGGIPACSEGLVLLKQREGWQVRHFERGSWYTLAECTTEEEACQLFLTYASDPFYRN
jgi:hypothetical protein